MKFLFAYKAELPMQKSVTRLAAVRDSVTLVRLIELAQAVTATGNRLARQAGRAGDHELRGHQFDGMSEAAELSRSVVGAGAGLYADQAGGRWATISSSWPQAILGLKNISLTYWSTPCKANTLLAKSMPTVIIFMDFPFQANDLAWKLNHGSSR